MDSKGGEQVTNMRKLRKAKGLTLKQVGKRIGRNESCISHYETGQRKLPVATAKKLANEYGCDWTELYEDEDKDDGKTAVG